MINLPAISSSARQQSGSPFPLDEPVALLKKRNEKVSTPEPMTTGPNNLKLLENDLYGASPKFMTGYTGYQKYEDAEVDTVLPKLLKPVVGYTGYYRGKVGGKLGRPEVHTTNLSVWEKETVSDILGIPPVEDAWEFAHYTSTCRNFSRPITADRSEDFEIDHGSNSSSYISKMNNSHDPQLQALQEQPEISHSSNSQPLPSDAAVDAVFGFVQQCFEARFKTAVTARATLKSAFFDMDPFRNGYIESEKFFSVLYKMGGVVLSEEEIRTLSAVLFHDPVSLADSAVGSGTCTTQKLNYGRFLNIIVPRSSGGSNSSNNSK
mmetsp:Transcript_32158/g.54225  ORF Transcript_32158/g.54225 Transcript_32158/m.54225 type:complete len:321 (+) Transcript_32158:31-993(+)